MDIGDWFVHYVLVEPSWWLSTYVCLMMEKDSETSRRLVLSICHSLFVAIMFLILIILSCGSDIWGVLAALTWVGFSFFLLVDSIQYLHKLPSSITADLLQLAMLLTPGVKHLFLFRHILEARSELKFHGILGWGTGFQSSSGTTT